MTHDINVLIAWIRACVILAAITTTAVPIIYSFSPWRARLLGRLFMLQAASFAAAIDLTALFSFWKPDVLIVFWIDAVVLTAISVSTSALTWKIWILRRKQRPQKRRGSHAVW